MEPKFFPLRQGRQRRKIINRTNIDSAGRSYDEERCKSRVSINRYGIFKGADIDLMTAICWDHTKRLGAQA